MATNYPGAIDSLTNPSAGDALTSPSHSAQHANANDAIEAIETELGVNPSGSDATVAARLSAIEAGTNLATGAVTSAKIAAHWGDNAEWKDAVKAWTKEQVKEADYRKAREAANAQLRDAIAAIDAADVEG